MPLSVVTSVLEAGFELLFVPATAPATTEQAADMWARAYVNYVLAGGIPDAALRQQTFAAALAQAFNPNLGGGGPALFTQALQVFWLGLSVPAQAGIVTAFIPPASVDSKQPDNATPQDEARGLAVVIAGLTLGAVLVTVLPLGPVVPLL